MPSSTSDLLDRLRYFVQAEAQAQYDALDKQWSRPLGERVAKGWAIEGIRVVKYEKGIVRLRCDSNISRFREGDLLLMHRGNPHDPDALHVELQYDAETELETSIIRGNQLQFAATPTGWIIDQDWFDSSPFYLDALLAVADTMRGRSLILPLLQGSLTPKIDFARYTRALEVLTETVHHDVSAMPGGSAHAGLRLNESQVQAVALAYATDLLRLIQGPPGTGKTLMLAHLARLLVEDGLRVFVTALTHRAIHNALNKIPLVDDSLPVCKIGESRHTGDLDVPNFENFDETHFGDLNGGYIVGATPFALHTSRLANVEFDVVLFDEASQVTLPLAIMGMLAGNKYIFIGDENQLPPVTVLPEQQAAQTSIFGYLAGRGNETMLNITYRLNRELAAWPSRTFYHSELQSSAEAAKRRLCLGRQATRWDFVLDPASPLVFLDLCHRNTTVRSRIEAETVVELILALLDHEVSPDEIGVVTPYRAQSRLIRSLLRRSLPKNTGEEVDICAKIAVDTVERMQGQEREVVLISFATASPVFAAQMADFLFQPQRLNVAVTRPRTKLILVGSRHMLEGDQVDENHAQVFALLKDLVDACQVITLPDGSLV